MTQEPDDLPVTLTRAGLLAEVKRLTRLVEIWQQQAADVDTLRCAEIEGLQSALWCIVDMCPATAEVTLAHQMADVAMAVLGLKPMTREPTITVAMYRDAVRDLAELRAEIERLKDYIAGLEDVVKRCGPEAVAFWKRAYEEARDLAKTALGPKP